MQKNMAKKPFFARKIEASQKERTNTTSFRTRHRSPRMFQGQYTIVSYGQYTIFSRFCQGGFLDAKRPQAKMRRRASGNAPQAIPPKKSASACRMGWVLCAFGAFPFFFRSPSASICSISFIIAFLSSLCGRSSRRMK